MKKISVILFIVVISTCSSPEVNPGRSAGPAISSHGTDTPAQPTSVASPTDIPVPQDRVGVRQVNGAGEFYDRESG